MLDHHRYDKLLGRWEDLEINGTEITATPHFNSKNELAAQREQEVNDNFLNGSSIGIDYIDLAMGDMYGYPDTLVVVKSVLREISLCTIPSNGNAIQLYRDGNPLTETEIKELKLNYKPNPSPKSPQMDRKILIKKLKLSADATDEQIEAAMDALENSQSDTEQKLKDAEKQLETEQATKIELMVDTAISQKKITADQKASYIALAKSNYDETKKVLDAMKAPVKPMELLHKGKQAPASQGGREDWDYDDFAAKASGELRLMMHNDPERFAALQQAKIDKVRATGRVRD